MHEFYSFVLVGIMATAFGAIAIYLLVHFTKTIAVLKVPYIKGGSLLVLMLCLGFSFAYNLDERHYLDYFKKQQGKYLVVRITALPQQKSKSIKIEAQVKAIGEVAFKKCRGNLLLYLQPKENVILNYGDEIVLLSRTIKMVPSPQNPYEFDFQRYLHINNIHHQTYINNKQWTPLNCNSGYAIFKITFAIQKYLHRSYCAYISNIQHRGLVEALVFGYRSDLDKAIISAYSKTGIIHVLAVSGLHVGLIYSVLSFITFSLKNTLFKKRIRVVIIILFLLGYAMLTGLSPSVCRAVLMFSFFVFKDAIKRETNVYNVLSASAVILLAIQPMWLFHVGFQLSYLAVFSIVFLQAYIKNWLPITDWFLAKAWTLLAVSIAAQIVTFPLCLYYFHQYPNLFFISNLIIIPLIFIVLSLAAILPLFASIKLLAPLAHLTSKLISIYLDFINTTVFKIQSLPYSYFDDLYINFNEMWLIYGLVFSILIWLIYKIPKLIWAAFLFIGLLLFSQINRQKLNQNTKAWLSFAIKGHTNLGYKNGADLYLFADSALANSKLIEFHCKPWFLAKCGGKILIQPMNSLTTSPINTLTINNETLYILPKSKSKIMAQIPKKSTVFCLRPVYNNHLLQHQLKIIAPSFKQIAQPINWHSINKNGFWIKPICLD